MKFLRRITPWKWFMFLAGIVLVIHLASQIDLREMLHQALNIPFNLFVYAGLWYLAKASFRSLRLQRITQPFPGKYVDMLRLVLSSTLASQLLPFKLGEAAYVVLLRRSRGMKISQAVSALVALRAIDLVSVSLLFLLCTLFLGHAVDARLQPILTIALLLFATLSLAFVVGILAAGWIDARIQRYIEARGERKPRLSALLRSLSGFLNQFSSYRPRDLLEWTLIGMAEWFVNYLSFHLLLTGLGIQPTFYATIVTVTFAGLASVLPVNSFGNFGTQEAGWAAGLTLMGYSQQAALSSGFSAHLLTVVYMLVLGIPAWISYLVERSAGDTHR